MPTKTVIPNAKEGKPPTVNVEPEMGDRDKFTFAVCTAVAGAVESGFDPEAIDSDPLSIGVKIIEKATGRSDTFHVSFRFYLRQENPEAWAENFAREQVAAAIQRIREQADKETLINAPDGKAIPLG